jgi:hypothetical protein
MLNPIISCLIHEERRRHHRTLDHIQDHNVHKRGQRLN